MRCADVPDVGAPGAGEVVFDVLASPVNPADISMCRGTCRLRPPLPATPGAECIGRVTAIGAAVTHVRPGGLVISLQRECWTQRRRVRGEQVIRNVANPAGEEIAAALAHAQRGERRGKIPVAPNGPV